jgi:hypothetical protein
MLQKLLATYMAFALAAGPGLCCCTAAHLVAGPPPAAGSDPADDHPPCCCCPADRPAPPAGDPCAQAPAPPKSRGHHCPCRETGDTQQFDRAAAASPAEPLPSRFVPPAFALIPLDAPTAAQLAAPGQAGERSSILPFLSARDLLHVHHLLRC